MMRSLKIFGIVSLILCSQLSVDSLRKAPPGMQAVPGLRNTFLDKLEITNTDWRIYLQNLKDDFGDTSKEYENALPDLALWQLAYSDDFLDSTAKPHHPLVAITFQQAEKYCRWRSKLVSNKENRKIHFTLPEIKVYKMVLNESDASLLAEGLYSTRLGYRNFLGLCDNAAEMTRSDGYAIHGFQNDTCLAIYEYQAPSHLLGFRCMARLR